MESQFAKFLRIIKCNTVEHKGVRSATREFTQSPLQPKIVGRCGEDIEKNICGGSPDDEENILFGNLRDFTANPPVEKQYESDPKSAGRAD